MATSKDKNITPNPENLDIDDPNLEGSELAIEENIVDFVTCELTDEELDKEVEKLEYKKPEALEIYKILIDTRKFEIENFWKRTVFFWGVVAIFLAGYFNAKNSEQYLLFASYLGFFYNLIFSLSIRGSKYWQEHWESAATAYERKLKFRLFSWQLGEKIKEDNKSVFYLLRPFRHSVSKLTMMLSDLTLILWLILITKDFLYLLSNSLIHFDFGHKSEIHYFTLTTVLVPIICVAYIVIFLIYGTRKK